MRPEPKNDNGLPMRGHIRTEQSCPKCLGKFIEAPTGYLCPKCLTKPTRLYIDILYDGERVRIFKDESGQPIDSYERAKREHEAINWKIDHKQFYPSDYKRKKYEPYLFTNYVKNWLKEQKIRLNSNDISLATYDKSKSILERFIVPYFGVQDVRKVTTRQVKNFNLHLASTVVKGGNIMSAKYREYIIGLLRQLYYDGMNSGDLTRAQVPVFPSVDTPDKYFDVLEEHDQDKILEKIPVYDFPIFHFILWYGVRPSEARALKRDCIKHDYGEVVIKRTFTKNNKLRNNPKQNKWRILSLLPETIKIIRALPVSITGYVFVNKWGRPYSQDYLNRTWNATVKNAGYNYIPLKNASRHSLGTKLAKEGYGKDIIAEVLGHSDTKVTENYVRYAAESLKPFFKRKRSKKGTVSKLSVKKGRKR